MALRKAHQGSRALALSLLWVCLLIACYWVLSEWQHLPRMLSTLKAGLHWPV
jgi:hypothetical protein